MPGSEEVERCRGYRVDYESLKDLLVLDRRRVDKQDNYSLQSRSTLDKARRRQLDRFLEGLEELFAQMKVQEVNRLEQDILHGHHAYKAALDRF